MANTGYTGVPTTEPQAAPAPFQRFDVPRANAAEFGGQIGEGLIQAGQGARVAATFFGEAAADNASNDYADETRKIMYGDPANLGPDGKPVPGFMQLQGRAAMDARPDVERRLGETRDRIKNTMLTPQQSLRFDDFSRKHQQWAADRIAGYADQQSHVWYDKVEEATAKRGHTQISINPEDPAAVIAGRESLRQAYVQKAQRLGATPDTEEGRTLIKAAIDKADREAVEAQALAIGATDVPKAMRIIEANKNELGESYPKLVAHFKPQIGQINGHAAGDAAWSETGGPGSPAGFKNNIGAIGHTNINYPGKGGGYSPDAGRKFETFNSPEEGVAASYNLMARKAKDNGGSITFNDLIGGNAKVLGWAGAPKTAADQANPMLKGNNPSAYAERLAKSVGLTGADNVPIGDDAKMARILEEQNRIEHGGKTVPDDAYGNGIKLAKGDKSVIPTKLEEKAAPPMSLEQRKGAAITKILDNPYYQQHPNEQSAALHQIDLRYTAEHETQVNQTQAFSKRLSDATAEAQATGDNKNPIPEQDFYANIKNPDLAERAYSEYQGALQFGADKRSLQSMSPDQLRAAVEAVKMPEPGQEGYAKALQRIGSLQKASAEIIKERQTDPGMAALKQLPAVQSAYAGVQAAPQDPNAHQKFAAISLAEQERMGIPEDQRHVLPNGRAQDVVQHIMSSQDPRTDFDNLRATYGEYWPTIMKDLVSQGHMPPAMQAVSGLDKVNAQQLGQFLKGAEGQAKPGSAPKEHGKQLAEKVFGAGEINNPTDGADRLVADKMTDLRESWMKTTGPAGATFVNGMIEAAQNLTYAKMLQGVDKAVAAEQAAAAFHSNYKPLQMGSAPYAMVPSQQAETIENNATIALERLTPESLNVPQVFGTPGNPRKDEYINVLRSHPDWVTNQRGDGLWLRDMAGNYVRNADGSRFSLKFNAPRTEREQDPTKPLPGTAFQ